jgi:hypothetical protein
MQTREILTIIALSVLGLCLFIGIGKSMTKNPKKKMDCDKACGMLFFVAVVLLAVSQVLNPKENLTWPDYINGVGQGPLGQFGVYSIQAKCSSLSQGSPCNSDKDCCNGNLKCSGKPLLGSKKTGTCQTFLGPHGKRKHKPSPLLPPHFGK